SLLSAYSDTLTPLHALPTRRSSDLTYNYPTAISTLLSSVTSSAGPGTTFSYLDAAHDLRLGEIWHKDSGSQTISKFDYEYDVLGDRKSTRLNSSHEWISYAVFCLKK